jgi:copper chaperone CopZ
MATKGITGRAERLMIVRSHGGDCAAALRELEQLPGIQSVCVDRVTGAFNVVFETGIVSDDELGAALAHHGFEVLGWQQARIMHAGQQRLWLRQQIRSQIARVDAELAERGTYAEGVIKGSIDAYARAARAFGLITDEEVRALIPPRFLESEEHVPA